MACQGGIWATVLGGMDRRVGAVRVNGPRMVESGGVVGTALWVY